MKALLKFWRGHGTKVLGTVNACISGLIAIDGLISKDSLKYWLAAGVVTGIMTVRRGVTNQKAQ